MSSTIRFDNGDIEIDSTGGQSFIDGAEKAAQDLLEQITLPYDVVSDRGNEMFDPSGNLSAVTGNPYIGAQSIRTNLKSALRRLQRLQAADSSTSRDELIQRVNQIIVKPLNDDVTSYGFFISVTVDDQRIGVARAISMRHLGDTNTKTVGGYDP